MYYAVEKALGAVFIYKRIYNCFARNKDHIVSFDVLYCVICYDDYDVVLLVVSGQMFL